MMLYVWTMIIGGNHSYVQTVKGVIMEIMINKCISLFHAFILCVHKVVATNEKIYKTILLKKMFMVYSLLCYQSMHFCIPF